MKDQATMNYARRIALNEAKAKKAAADMKALYREGQKLKRAARTHRLCNLGGLLESYLKEPDLLDEDDVKRILDGLFSEYRTQRALERLLEQKRTGQSVSESVPAAESAEPIVTTPDLMDEDASDGYETTSRMPY